MNAQTKFLRAEQLETPVVVMTCPEDLAELATPERQEEARRIYNHPGIIVVDNAVHTSILIGLREGLSEERRKFKDKFNQGHPTTETFNRAYREASKTITELTRMLFGYDLPPGSKPSYRPMITENEPLHYDTYEVECGKISLMSVLNFDVRPRVWKVGPSFREICRDSREDLESILKNKHPGESPSVPLRSAGLRGVGPLKAGTPLHHVEFAPGTVWYANPKTVSHQIVYGGGAYFEQWTIDVPNCECQSCLIEELRVTVPNLRTPRSAATA
jgi:hypothetical protein